MSVVETLVGAAILTLSALAIGIFVIDLKKGNIRTEGSAICIESASQSILKIKATDNGISKVNWHMLSGVTRTPPGTPTVAELNLLGAPTTLIAREFPSMSNSLAAIQTPIATGTTVTYDLTNAWTLGDNATNMALKIYNGTSTANVANYPTICNGNPINGTPAGVLLTPGGPEAYDQFYPTNLNPSLINPLVFLRIVPVQYVDASTPLESCTQAWAVPPARVIPIGARNKNNMQMGLHITTTVTAQQDPNNVSKVPPICRSSTTLMPQGDTVPSQLVDAFDVAPNVMPPGCTASKPGTCAVIPGPGGKIYVNNNLGNITSASPPVSNGADTLFYGVAFNERAVVMGCDLEFSATAAPLFDPTRLQPCWRFSSQNGVIGTIDKVGPAGEFTAVRIRLDGLRFTSPDLINPDPAKNGFYRLFIRAFDIAQNETASDVVVNNSTAVCVSSCPDPATYCSTDATPDDYCNPPTNKCAAGTKAPRVCPAPAEYCPGTWVFQTGCTDVPTITCTAGNYPSDCPNPNSYCGDGGVDTCNRTCTGTNCAVDSSTPEPYCKGGSFVVRAATCKDWAQNSPCGPHLGGANWAQCCRYLPGKQNFSGYQCYEAQDPNADWTDSNGDVLHCPPYACPVDADLTPGGPGGTPCPDTVTGCPPATNCCVGAVGNHSCNPPGGTQACPCVYCGAGGGGGGGGNVCFIAGTMIASPTGDIAIEKIKSGDKVFSYDTKAGKTVVGVVDKTWDFKDKVFGEIEMSDGTKFGVTKEHSFYLVEKKKWVPAGKLIVGDKVFSGTGETHPTVTVARVDFSDKARKGAVYNFHVKKYKSYFANGILVHNANSNPYYPVTN